MCLFKKSSTIILFDALYIITLSNVIDRFHYYEKEILDQEILSSMLTVCHS